MRQSTVAERKSLLFQEQHSHVFLGEGHSRAERQAWAVIWLCGAMMTLEVVGGLLFGSVALIADGLHMSTHASALLLAALAYGYSRRHVGDRRFTFGTGKLGDLAGFTSAVILAMIAVLIGYEAVSRFIHPVPIHFREAIPIAFLGLAVNLASAWLLSRGGHEHHHDHHHRIAFGEHEHHAGHDREPHSHGPLAARRDNNMRAAIIHVAADAAVSLLVIVGLSLARVFGWLWMDPLAGTVGAVVIASWSFGLIRDTAGVLLDMNPDQALEESICGAVAAQGDRLTDLHVWRLGPGHLGAIVAVETNQARSPEFYREKLRHLPMLSHVTVEVHRGA
jgi:cation diffusion facilitator family transporter